MAWNSTMKCSPCKNFNLITSLRIRNTHTIDKIYMSTNYLIQEVSR